MRKTGECVVERMTKRGKMRWWRRWWWEVGEEGRWGAGEIKGAETDSERGAF